MLALVYDPAKVADPAAIATPLGIGVFIAGVPTRYAGYVLPPEGWVVMRETWAGVDVLAPPVTLAQVQALPDPGPDPAIAAAAHAAQVSGVLDYLRSTPIDPVKLDANLKAVAAYRALPSPTAGQTAAVVTPLIDVVGDLIRYVLSR